MTEDLPYLNQSCELTLKEGLEFHYSVNPSFKKNVQIVPAFYNHDIAHVVFGLSTIVEHESLVDTRVIFGTNWGFKNYFRDYFNDSNATKIIMQIFKDEGYVKTILKSLKSFPNVIKVIWDCKKMRKKWSINPSHDILNTKLSLIREEYRIKVIN